MDKYIGRLLDNRYEILEILGTGGMAVVYKARCHKLNRLVAIKILKDEYLEDEEFHRRFHSESQAVAMLSHPNIVSIYDVSTSVMEDYIVMELIDGITLKQYMEKKGVLNWKETLHFAIQIAKALEHAHSRGIVHRDIKPHNVMVLKNGSVKVTDFGIARMMSKGNTLTKEALGSVHYISPEQAKGGRVDSRSDIYSLGVVMYEMMSGRPPYDGESPVAVAIQHINGGAVMPSTLNPNIPGGLEQVIMKAMAHEPSQRYHSATQMLADMDEFRKNPGMLFDYNPSSADVLIRPSAQPLVLDPQPPRKETPDPREHPVRERGTPSRRRTTNPSRSGRNAPRRKAEEEKRNNTATVAIIACSLVVVVAIVIFLVMLLNGGTSPKTELITVPDLVGKVYAELQDYEDFDVKIDQEVHDNDFPAGQIISQTPGANNQIAKGKTVYVTVSLGKSQETVYMPSIVDWELSQAERSLNNLSMNVRIIVKEEFSETVAEGSVIRTEPAAETELSVGQEVTLYVSLGKEVKNSMMPDVVGKTRELAEKILQNQELDLKVKVEEEFSATVAAGEVIYTEPGKGEALKSGDEVKLIISKGPQLITMPDVVGFDFDKAVNLLVKTYGLAYPKIVQVESNQPKDTVVSQSVEENTQIDISTEVILEVSKGRANEPEITKDVTIDLRKSTESGECQVTVKRGDTVVFNEKVSQGTGSITIRGQKGSGTVFYEVMIGISGDGWFEKVSFDAAG